MQEIFFEAFFSLVRLFLSTNNEFLKQKLVKKSKEFFDNYNNVAQPDFTTYKFVAKSDHIVQRNDNVAQCDLENILETADSLQELIEILIHLKLVDLSPALLAQKSLLRLKSETLDSMAPKEKTKKQATGHVSKKMAAQQKNLYLKEKIMNYLKDRPEGAQANEIMNHFKTQLSRRSLQRYLNDLVSGGLITKDTKSGFPKYYSI